MNLLNSGTRPPLSPQFRLFPRPFPRRSLLFFFLFFSRNSRVAVAHRKWKRRPRHSHRVVILCISLAARPPFSLTVPRAAAGSLCFFPPPVAPPFAFSAWRISRNPNDVRAGSGFAFFVPGPPFSKRALKEKRTLTAGGWRGGEGGRTVFRSLHGNDRST